MCKQIIFFNNNNNKKLFSQPTILHFNKYLEIKRIAQVKENGIITLFNCLLIKVLCKLSYCLLNDSYT